VSGKYSDGPRRVKEADKTGVFPVGPTISPSPEPGKLGGCFNSAETAAQAAACRKPPRPDGSASQAHISTTAPARPTLANAHRVGNLFDSTSGAWE